MQFKTNGLSIAGIAGAGPKTVAMLVPGGVEHAGGIGRWAGYLAQAWESQALQPRLALIDTRSHGHAGRAAAAFAAALVRLVRLRASGELAAIHANLSKNGSTARKIVVSWLARRLGVPVVLHLHGSGYDDFYARLPTRLQRPVQAMFLRADRVVVLGQFWANWVAQTIGVDPAKIDILYNGVPTVQRSHADPSETPCHILLLGRIGPRKGVPELLQALASATMRDRDWIATVAGDGEVEAYRAQAASLGLSSRVSLPGWLSAGAAQAAMTSADILVLPSHAENFPISVIEALEAGVAVVTTPVGATPELLEHGRSALFIPPGDAVQLADALATLVDDPALRRRIAEAGHDVFRDKLDIDALARRLASLHARTIAAHSAEKQAAC